MDITQKRKITVRDVCGKLEPPDAPTELLNVWGVATHYKLEEDRFRPGEHVAALWGDFFAVNLETSEEFVSRKAFLPESFNASIVALIDKGTGQSVEFAATIGYKPRKGGSGYEYTVKHHVKPVFCDSMSHLRESFPKVGK